MQFVNTIFIQHRCCRQESSSFVSVGRIMALCFMQSIMTAQGEKKGAKWQWNEGGRTRVCGGENDKDRKNELGKQERLRVQKQTARGEVW